MKPGDQTNKNRTIRCDFFIYGAGDQIVSLSLHSLGSFALLTGILPSASRLRVELASAISRIWSHRINKNIATLGDIFIYGAGDQIRTGDIWYHKPTL